LSAAGQQEEKTEIANNSSDGSDTTICRAGQTVESVYLELIYWEAVGKKKKNESPYHTINYS